MPEAFDDALRRRLDVINGMGTSATGFAQQRATIPSPSLNPPNQGLRHPGSVGQPTLNAGDYGGPRGNHDALIAFGKLIQSLGGRVSENSFFNGGHRITSGHVGNSKHYKDRALDINFGPGTSRREQALIDKYLPLAAQYGLHSIWRAPGHYNHWHVDY